MKHMGYILSPNTIDMAWTVACTFMTSSLEYMWNSVRSNCCECCKTTVDKELTGQRRRNRFAIWTHAVVCSAVTYCLQGHKTRSTLLVDTDCALTRCFNSLSSSNLLSGLKLQGVLATRLLHLSGISLPTEIYSFETRQQFHTVTHVLTHYFQIESFKRSYQTSIA